MKSQLKALRANTLINFFLRIFFKGLLLFKVPITDKILQHITVSGVVKIILPDGQFIKLFSKGDDLIPTQVYWSGFDGYEYSISPFYYLAKKLNTVVDIGANIGYYSLVAAVANPNCNVFSFEPVQRIAERFDNQVKINKFSNIRIEELIVGNVDGSTTFYIPKGKNMDLAASALKGWISNVDEVDINSVKLDSYKEKMGIEKIDLIKIDCEFYELEVLQGMSDVLRNDKPVILMEVLFTEKEGMKEKIKKDPHKEIERIMKKNGYFFYTIKRNYLERVDNLEYNEVDRNFLFSPICSNKKIISFKDISSELL